MVSLRLSRRGKINQPSYRLIAVDKRKDPWGAYLEDLGFYNPLASPHIVKFNPERVKYWLSVGAQPSGTVHNLLVDAGILDKAKVRVGHAKKRATAPAPAQTPASPSAAQTSAVTAK